MSSRHRRNFAVSGFSFCRESFSIFRKVFFLPRVFFFCREVFLFFFSKVVYTRVEQESWKLLLKNDMIFYRVPIAMQNSFKSFLGWRVNDRIQLSVERWITYHCYEILSHKVMNCNFRMSLSWPYFLLHTNCYLPPVVIFGLAPYLVDC